MIEHKHIARSCFVTCTACLYFETAIDECLAEAPLRHLCVEDGKLIVRERGEVIRSV